MIHGHGDDQHQYRKTIRADFSSNVWFGGTSPDLISHLQEKLHLVGKYPEPDAAGLIRTIAASHEVNPAQVLAFNGSVEAFYTLALAFREAVSAVLYPAFAEYEDACRMHAHRLQFFRSDEWESALNLTPDLFWFGNPNNPDGHIFPFSQIETCLENYPGTVFVVDEAYADFIPGFQSAIPLTRKYSNLAVVRSLTKCHAIPGLRLGYMVASENLTCRLRKFQQPWSVNVLAQEAGKYLIEHQSGDRLNAGKIRELSLGLQQSVASIEGFRAVASEAPFFLVEVQSGTAAELKQFLLDGYGILIRDASNFRGLNERFFRICTRNEADNQLLVEGLMNFLEDKPPR